MFTFKKPDEGGAFYQKERRMVIFVAIFIVILIFDTVVLRTIDPQRLIPPDETSKDWLIEISVTEETETISEELSANQILETTYTVMLSENEYLESVSLVIQCSDEDEPGEGFSDEVLARTTLDAVDGSPADKEESSSCLENTEDDLVLTWMFLDVSSIELNQTEKTETEVLDLFEAGKTGTGPWDAEIELQVVTPGGITAVDNGEQVTVTWIVSTFEIELNVN